MEYGDSWNHFTQQRAVMTEKSRARVLEDDIGGPPQCYNCQIRNRYAMRGLPRRVLKILLHRGRLEEDILLLAIGSNRTASAGAILNVITASGGRDRIGNAAASLPLSRILSCE